VIVQQAWISCGNSVDRARTTQNGWPAQLHFRRSITHNNIIPDLSVSMRDNVARWSTLLGVIVTVWADMVAPHGYCQEFCEEMRQSPGRNAVRGGGCRAVDSQQYLARNGGYVSCRHQRRTVPRTDCSRCRPMG
jgi:hypothetical protein